MVSRIEFILEMPAVSQNVLSRRYKSPFQYKRYRDQAQLMVRAVRVNNRLEHATGKRRVTLTRLMAKRERAFDYGNLVGGFKPVVDALVRERLLVDDSPKWCEQRYEQQTHGFSSAIRVCLEPLEEGN